MNKSLPCILHQKNEYKLHTQIRITFPRRKLSVTSRGTVFFKLMNSFDMTGSGELLNHTELNYLSSLGNSISIMNLSFSGDRDSISFFFIFLSSSMHNSHRCRMQQNTTFAQTITRKEITVAIQQRILNEETPPAFSNHSHLTRPKCLCPQ